MAAVFCAHSGRTRDDETGPRVLINGCEHVPTNNSQVFRLRSFAAFALWCIIGWHGRRYSGADPRPPLRDTTTIDAPRISALPICFTNSTDTLPGLRIINHALPLPFRDFTVCSLLATEIESIVPQTQEV